MGIVDKFKYINTKKLMNEQLPAFKKKVYLIQYHLVCVPGVETVLVEEIKERLEHIIY